ncbi:DUF2591 family protein [Cronobacter sakazakii]|uniref:phage protein NinX family protein n=1 Tax=Cronobacter sakazakii TaxID=28141 RepID=UPI00294AE217|nr:phage protein NinX family protein [Cronobacter sakazakii]MDI7612008.1 DUF2591 family protein [Cronobacter sakazakii]MDI7616201.1 DUF2591 family protein [Cronobacter sakazakii]
MDYSQLSDFEINLKVAHIILGSGNYDWSPEKKEVYLAGIDGGVFLPNGYFDPCNNPADAWPIIHDNRISLVIDDTTDEWSSALVNDFSDDMAFQHSNANKNPLRAAMITFLLIQESQHA